MRTIIISIVLLFAVLFDFLKGKIPNLLLMIGYIAGCIYMITTDTLWYFHIIDSLLLLMILYPLFLVGAFGGGDIKLIVTLGVLIDFEESIKIAIVALAIGAIISILKILFLFCCRKEFQFSNLYIHFSLPISLGVILIHYFGGITSWQIF